MTANSRLLAGLLFVAVPSLAHAAGLAIYPTRIALTGPRDQQRVGVLGRDARFRCADPKVAQVDATGTVRPVGDGSTTVTVEASGQTATIPVTVKGATTDPPTNFV